MTDPPNVVPCEPVGTETDGRTGQMSAFCRLVSIKTGRREKGQGVGGWMNTDQG